MASLTDKIKAGGANQSVASTTSGGQQSTSLMEAVRQSGASVPTTPLAASSFAGVSPDSAKMVGTPAQTQSANKSLMGILKAPKIVAEQTKSEARQSEITQQFEKDQAAKDAEEVANRMSGLGSLGKRLPDLIMIEATKGTAAPSIKLAPGALDGTNLTADQKTTIGAIVGNANLSGLEMVSQLAKAGMSIPELQAKGIISAGDAQAFADAVKNADTIKMTDLFKDPASIQEATGYGSVAELEAATGLKNVGEMTYGQLKQALEGTAMEYSTPMALQQIVNNPAASNAAKMDAAKQLRRIGATGQRTAEEKIGDLVAQVVDGDQIQVDGKPMKVEDLLEDKTLLPIIKDALEDPTGQGLLDLEEVSPELAKWVKSNQQAVKDWVAKVDKGQTEFAAVKAEEKKLAVVSAPGATIPIELPDNIMEWMTNGAWGDNNITPAQIDPNKKAMYDEITKIESTKDKAALVKLLTTMANEGKLDEIGNAYVTISGYNPFNGDPAVRVPLWSKEGMAKLGLNTSGGITAFENKLATVLPAVKRAKEDVGGAGGDELLNSLTGIKSYDELAASYANPETQKAMEFIVKNNLGNIGLFDSNRDGVLDDKATVINNLLKFGGGNLQDIIDGRGNPDAIRKLVGASEDLIKDVKLKRADDESAKKQVEPLIKAVEANASPQLATKLNELLNPKLGTGFGGSSLNIAAIQRANTLKANAATNPSAITYLIMNDPAVKEMIANYDLQASGIKSTYYTKPNGAKVIRDLIVRMIPSIIPPPAPKVGTRQNGQVELPDGIGPKDTPAGVH